MRRDLDVAALLEPRVPADADTGELGHFLAPQARGAAARAGDETDIGRREARSTADKKRREVAAFGIAFEVRHGSPVTSSNRISYPILILHIRPTCSGSQAHWRIFVP